MSSDPWVRAAASGVALELTGEPVQTTSPGRRPMSAGQETALEAEVKALREKDVIYEAPDPQRNFLSPLFAVPKADGKIRPVVDLRALNAWLEYLGKSVLLPRQTLEFLGFEVCSVSTTLQLAKHRVQRILCSCREVLERQELTVRQVASCIGMLGAAWPGVLPTPPHLRGLQRLLAGASRQRLPWEARIRINQETRQDLAWWVRHHQGSAE